MRDTFRKTRVNPKDAESLFILYPSGNIAWELGGFGSMGAALDRLLRYYRDVIAHPSRRDDATLEKIEELGWRIVPVAATVKEV